MPNLCSDKNRSKTYGWPSMYSFYTSTHSTNSESMWTAVFTTEKNPHVSRFMQFKPMVVNCSLKLKNESNLCTVTDKP